MNRLNWRRIALSCAVVLLFATSLSASTITPQIGGGISQFDGGISSGGGGAAPTFFFATAGSDSNLCTQASPCQTVTKANTMAAGSIVKFNGGDTFSTTTGITADASVASYGTGQATISSGNSAACVTNTNPAGARTISNIICTGGGNLTNTTAGISFVNSQAGNTKLAGPTISGVTVSGYGSNGIEVRGTSGSSGFNNTTISNNTVHDVTGNGNAATSCITVNSFPSAYGTNNANQNVTINGNTAYNCTGKASATQVGVAKWSGSGIDVFETQFATITNNIVHDTGVNNTGCGGPAGIWTSDADSITIKFNESYHNLTNTGSGGCDGHDFDLDAGTTNSVMMYNYAHDGTGYSYAVFSYSDGTIGPASNNTVAWNIGQNDTLGVIGIGHQANITGCQIFQNSGYSSIASAGGVSDAGTGTTAGTYDCKIANNIFYIVAATGKLINLAAGATGATFNNNDYYGNGTINWNGTPYATIALWQTGTSQDSNAKTSEPRLVVYGGGGTTGGYVPTSLAQYQLQSGSPMLAAGANLQTLYSWNPGSTDYYGVAVTASSLPIGAGQTVIWTNNTGTCSQATTFLARTSSPPTTTQEQYNALICGLVADGSWTSLDALYKIATDSSTDAALNLVSSSFSLVAHNSPTFTANVGYAGNGTNAYLDTQYNTATNNTNRVQNSAMDFVYLENPAGASPVVEYGNVNATNASALFRSSTAHSTAYSNEALSAGFTSSLNPAGAYLTYRTGASAEGLYINGVSAMTGTNASAALVSQTMFLLGYNNNGSATPGSPTTDTVSYFAMGSSPPTAIAATQFSYRINADAAALGINGF